MDLITYQKLSAKTEKPMGPAARLRHARLGVLTELGEFASTAKKILVYGKPRNDPALVKNMHEELGDFAFYAVIPFNVFDCEGVRVLMTHIGGYPRRYDPRALARIRSVHPKLFVSGHSHILKVMYDPIYDLLHINPGAAGEYGFHKVRTAVRLTIDGTQMRDMEVGEWSRR